jgi:hypothetical protein
LIGYEYYNNSYFPYLLDDIIETSNKMLEQYLLAECYLLHIMKIICAAVKVLLATSSPGLEILKSLLEQKRNASI